ncbi:hypothetical protein V8G54_036945 [Vigna mungo]|uniref:Uncharacterized protein n=1 Tax=Vigna mungo TaxID=3915 RepID=A0AAQ3MI82_VIGMU
MSTLVLFCFDYIDPESPENKRCISIIKGIVIVRRNAGINTTFRIRRQVAGCEIDRALKAVKENGKVVTVAAHGSSSSIFESDVDSTTYLVSASTLLVPLIKGLGGSATIMYCSSLELSSICARLLILLVSVGSITWKRLELKIMVDPSTPLPSQSDEKSQSSTQPKRRRTIRLKDLTISRSVDQRLSIQFDMSTGKVLGDNRVRFTSFIALLGRSKISILIDK